MRKCPALQILSFYSKTLSLLIFLISGLYINLFSQNVGIGTTTPQNKLHVFGNGDVIAKVETAGPTNLAGLLLKTRANANDHLQLVKWMSGTTGTIAGIPLSNLSVVASGFGAGPLAIGTLGNYPFHIITNNIERIRITPEGYVGIGVTNPAFKLDVNGRIRVRNDGFETAGIWFNNSNNSTAGFAGLYDDHRMGFYGNGAGWSFLMDVNTGNISIGPTTPGTSRLKVVGGTATNALEVSGAIKVTGNNAPAFKLIAGSSNLYDQTPDGAYKSIIIDNSLCNNDPKAMVFVSPAYGPGSGGTKAPLSVAYDNNLGKWKIRLISMQSAVEFLGFYYVYTCGGLLDPRRPVNDAWAAWTLTSGFSKDECFNVLIINR